MHGAFDLKDMCMAGQGRSVNGRPPSKTIQRFF